MTVARPYRAIAEDLIMSGPWTFGRESTEYYLDAIEAALVNAVAAKDEEIFRLNRALSYANTLNEDLLKEIRTLRDGICQAQDERFWGRHGKP